MCQGHEGTLADSKDRTQLCSRKVIGSHPQALYRFLIEDREREKQSHREGRRASKRVSSLPVRTVISRKF